MAANKKLTKAQKEHRSAVVGALFSAGDRDGAMALLRGKITTAEAARRLR